MSKKITEKRAVQAGGKQLALPQVLGEALHEFVIQAGLNALHTVLEEERTRVCGPKHQPNANRAAYRAGTAPGELVLGGRRASVRRPRVRTVDGEEVELPSWILFSHEDPLNERALEQMAIGVSTRKYERSLEAVDVHTRTRGASKSAVSRRFVAMTSQQLEQMLNADLSDKSIVGLMIDGIFFKNHVVLVALGIDKEGNKHVLGIQEGATENARACTDLLSNLVDRGLSAERSILVVIDGAKALRKAVGSVFGHKAVVQRCQLHKRRNVKDYLPKHKQQTVDNAMKQAYATNEVNLAKRQLENLARSLELDHPSAAASIREGLDETLVVKAFGLTPALERTLSTTNPIENMQGRIRAFSRRVKRWRSGSMVLRWVGAALLEASKGFRKLKGGKGMPRLISALRAGDSAQTLHFDTAGRAA